MTTPKVYPLAQADTQAAQADTVRVLVDVRAERTRQDVKFDGAFRHYSWTPPGPFGDSWWPHAARQERMARMACDAANEEGRPCWPLILLEEVWEALAAQDPAQRRKELIQVAAVATAMAEQLDREAMPYRCAVCQLGLGYLPRSPAATCPRCGDGGWEIRVTTTTHRLDPVTGKLRQVERTTTGGACGTCGKALAPTNPIGFCGSSCQEAAT